MSSTPPRIGPYRIDGLLGSGGMGSVYLGVHETLGHEAAVKVLHGENPTQAARFRREARALLRLSHPNVVTILEVGEGPPSWIATERVVGESLEERLRHGPLPLEEARAIGVVLCDVLEVAHALGLLHRDLKPDNVLIDAEGRPVLVDFGLVKDLEIAESIRLSQSGRLMGTPGYWSPEQAAGNAPSAATDVYGLGATLYALVTGGPPFAEPSILESVLATCERQPEPPSLERPDTPAWFERAILGCLAKEPAERPSLDALRAQLLAQGQANAEPRSPLWLIPLTLLLLGGLAAWGLTRGEPLQPATPRESSSPTDTAPVTLFERGRAAFRAGRLEEAVRCFDESARLGDPRAQRELGLLYAMGRGTEQSYAKAHQLLGQASEQGDVEATYLFASLYLNGHGVEKDLVRAVEIYARAAEGGHAVSARLAGSLYLNGAGGVPKDHVLAARFLQQAAEAGEVEAMVPLGYLLRSRDPQPGDLEASVRWLRLGAEAGDAEGMTATGLFLAKGDGVKQDLAAAATWYRKAAELGNTRAMRLLGEAHFKGEGVEEDPEAALSLYRRSAESDPISMTGLASFYAMGKRVPKDFVEAERWLTRAAEAGHVPAARQLGMIFARGQGVPKDFVKAARWFKVASEGGDLVATGKLATFYQSGLGGLPQDGQMAFSLYRRAAEGGQPFAMAKLSELYFEGEIVEKDLALAAAWVRKASDLGHAHSMTNMAHLYTEGLGVERDLDEAVRWYRAAIAAGNERARRLLAELYAKHPELKGR